MNQINPHNIDSEIGENSAPVYVASEGIYQFSDGKQVQCHVLWSTDAIKNTIFSNLEFDEEDVL